MKPAIRVLLLIGLMRLAAAPSQAEDLFPPITDEERAITSVPGAPNAPAVVLFKRGELVMEGYGLLGGGHASHLRVRARVKILTEEGKGSGEIAVSHSDLARLKNFTGRTVLPDGRIVPVPPDARFVRKSSLSKKTFVTALAFPAITVGAILDYQYELAFDSPFLLEPWYFPEEVPVLHSEIVFKTPKGWEMQVWKRALLGVKIQEERQTTARGGVLRAWADDLLPVPDDPYGPPYSDLASQILLLPRARTVGKTRVPLLDTWDHVSQIFDLIYSAVRRGDGGVAQQAQQIAGSGSPAEKTESLYRFVRDEIETAPAEAPDVAADSTLQTILSKRRGNPAEKALLLQALFKTVGIDSRLVWAGDRNRSTIDPQLPNPSWFDRVLVLILRDGKAVYLDPSDRALGFGQLQAGYEGTPALIPKPGQAVGIVLPEAPFDQNGRRAEIDLTLDAKGALSGRGQLVLTGHHAWEKIRWQHGEEKTAKAWKDWLSGQFRDFRISDASAIESPDQRKVTVTWSMAQRQEEVLGDEVSLMPSLPLGPMVQPLTQPVSERRTAVMFDCTDRNEVELHLRWPAGWRINLLPSAASVQNGIGALATDVVSKEGENSLVYRRRFDINRRVLDSRQDYETAQLLFAAAAKSDAQALVLVRE
ncbi:MAG TPA: DUF3857 and transglutaminase domain-containing protein [Thermoanaerobaculia bacterium]|jgi:transglutaminase-like putative cysteine protease|nr:DUF3857 and transglutaminase domain-containing protein [Thermoanaerobaculia bacterium]